MDIRQAVLVLSLLIPVGAIAKGKNLECSHTYSICSSDAQHAWVKAKADAKKNKDKAGEMRAEEQYKAQEKVCKDDLKRCEGH